VCGNVVVCSFIARLQEAEDDFQRKKENMSTTYLSLAMSATMFPLPAHLSMRPLSPAQVKDAVAAGVVSALNPSHASTIEVIRRKFGIDLPIPERAPKVSLTPSDRLILIQANLPRLAEGARHSDETVAAAPISFIEVEVLS
jgi:hypothetical protein